MGPTVSIATYAILHYAAPAGTVSYLTKEAARAQALCPTRKPGRSLPTYLLSADLIPYSHIVAQKIKAVLEPEITEEEQEGLHQDDEDTTWFGINREDGLPLFQDYGRYANLMLSSSQNGTGGRDTRCPSLVSFVGQTGELGPTTPSHEIGLTLDDRRWEKYRHQISD